MRLDYFIDDFIHGLRRVLWGTIGCVAGGLLGIASAHASDATLTWTLPTQNTDGTAIPATGAGSIASTRVEYGSCSGTAFGTKAGEVVVNAPALTTTITGLAPATWCFRAFARNTFGAESGPSGVVSTIINPPTPKPPVLSSTVTVAWDLKGGKPNKVVGNIALGTPCGAFVVKQRQARYYEVSFDAVQFTRTPRSTRVVTRCAIS